MTEEFDDIELMDADTDSDGQLYEHLRMEVDRGQEPVRIDKYMSEHVQHSSRNRIQKAADAGFIQVNGKPVKSNYKVRPGDVITLMLDRPHYDTTIEPEDIPLDVVYEDDQLMVINKPAGLVVHPGVGNFHGTLVNAIAWHLRNRTSTPYRQRHQRSAGHCQDTRGQDRVGRAVLQPRHTPLVPGIGMGQLHRRYRPHRRKYR